MNENRMNKSTNFISPDNINSGRYDKVFREKLSFWDNIVARINRIPLVALAEMTDPRHEKYSGLKVLLFAIFVAFIGEIGASFFIKIYSHVSAWMLTFLFWLILYGIHNDTTVTMHRYGSLR